MAIVDLFDLPSYGPLIGIDPGSKTLGIAGCDAGRLIASPVETIRKGRKLGPSLDRLFELADMRRIVGLVIGLPLNMDGSEGPRVQSTRAFARNLAPKIDLPIAFWDERLSTSAVERVLIEQADMTRARRGQVVDKMAASFILQGALDARRLRPL